MLVSRIDWETDGNEIDLPTEVEVPDEIETEEIADYLSDTYDYLVNGFSIPMDENDRDYFGEYVNKAEG